MGLRTRLFRFHRRVIDPGQGGLGLTVARALLRGPAALYGAVAAARNACYRRGWLKSRSSPVPVISIGNVTAGGTGKTPMVAWLARLMVIHKMRPAILSRGYGRDPTSGLDDENEMLARRAGDIPIVVNPNRVEGAERAVREHHANVLIMDDGFQHRRLARDLDVVLIDALLPFGGGHILPRGLLREPLHGLRRADFLILTRSDLVEKGRREEIKRCLAELAPDAPVACCKTQVAGLRALAGGDAPLSRLREGRWGAFCGIGNPEAFRLTLRQQGCRLEFFRAFPDHMRYRDSDLRALRECARRRECLGLVTTEKDAVKLHALTDREQSSAPPLYTLQVKMDFTHGSPSLTAAILEVLGRTN